MAPKKEIIPVLANQKANLSREQKFFNSRVKKISKLKTEVARLQDLLNETRAKRAELIEPIEHELLEVNVSIVQAFDQAYDSKFFRKKEKEKIIKI